MLKRTPLVADVTSVRLFLHERLAPAVALLGAGAVLPGASLHFLGHDQAHFSSGLHFYGVGVSAAAAAFAAVALSVGGARRGDGRVVLLGTGFTVMAALLAVHGLATPGVIIGTNGVIAFTGGATLPVGGAVLALSALPSLRRPQGIRTLLVLQVVCVAAIVTLGVVGMVWPASVPSMPQPASASAIAALVVGVGFYALLILRALKTYLLTRRTADLVVVIGIAWLTAALPPAMLLSYLDLGWWLGHGFELIGILLVGLTVAADLYRSAQSRPLVGDLRAHELVAKEETFLGTRVRALTRLLAEKDESTEEHTRRVALLAVRVGEELGLPPGRLRALAIGGLLHDIGKLSVPEAILNKPAALDDEEYAVVQRHPEAGYKLLRELGGFSDAVRELVRSHHERLDGNGYPRGVGASRLELDARILTVCDVYDALVSPRVYRNAWPHAAAMRILHDETGSAFDPACVRALEKVLERAHGAPQLAAVASA